MGNKRYAGTPKQKELRKKLIAKNLTKAPPGELIDNIKELIEDPINLPIQSHEEVKQLFSDSKSLETFLRSVLKQLKYGVTFLDIDAIFKKISIESFFKDFSGNSEIKNLLAIIQWVQEDYLFYTITFDKIFELTEIPLDFKNVIKKKILETLGEKTDLFSHNRTHWGFADYQVLYDAHKNSTPTWEILAKFPGCHYDQIRTAISNAKQWLTTGKLLKKIQKEKELYESRKPTPNIPFEEYLVIEYPGNFKGFEDINIAGLKTIYKRLLNNNPDYKELPVPKTKGGLNIFDIKDWIKRPEAKTLIEQFKQTKFTSRFVSPEEIFPNFNVGKDTTQSLQILVKDEFFENTASSSIAIRNFVKFAETKDLKGISICNVDKINKPKKSFDQYTDDQKDFIKTSMFGDGTVSAPVTLTQTTLRFFMPQAVEILKNTQTHVDYLIDVYKLLGDCVSSMGLSLKRYSPKDFNVSNNLQYSWGLELSILSNFKELFKDFYPVVDNAGNLLLNESKLDSTVLDRSQMKRMPIDIQNLLDNYFKNPFQNLCDLYEQDGFINNINENLQIPCINAFTNHQEDCIRLSVLIYIKTGLKFYITEKLSDKTKKKSYSLVLCRDSINDFVLNVCPLLNPCFRYKECSYLTNEYLNDTKIKKLISRQNNYFQTKILKSFTINKDIKSLFNNTND